jgi:NAD(P)-dependent dehydrogenase (short-subunit alcohol dehydrogenase family)
MKNVFITGASSGIGHALAEEYLRRGWRVHAVSRRTPADLAEYDKFTHAALDLNDHARTAAVVSELLREWNHLDLAVLNAGVLGRFDDLANVGLDQLKRVMEINLWANKTVVDVLFSEGRTVAQVVSISSGASVTGNRGWAGYSISKASLNMLTKLYAREHPESHFCAFAPGVIDTAMLNELCSMSHDERFPALDSLRSKRSTAEMPTPEQAAGPLVDAIASLPRLVSSGEYADVRKLKHEQA